LRIISDVICEENMGSLIFLSQYNELNQQTFNIPSSTRRRM